ncbi:MAG: hypothetical protein COT74_09105 [Bdellovibrionales bacterium CG10_big_fil_rev_8_21_14_0_10_45_34]|nr:MAG: hypothetical protein COT74_09105 [Bdellovibrionales bacterium CG10_big_fil_rev_8_21_14_0_10_45_34]
MTINLKTFFQSYLGHSSSTTGMVLFQVAGVLVLLLNVLFCSITAFASNRSELDYCENLVQAPSKVDPTPAILQPTTTRLEIPEDSENLRRQSQIAKSKLVGRDALLQDLLKTIEAKAAFSSKTDAPILSIMAVGPTGTGKSQLAKALAAALHGDEGKVLRINMGEAIGDYSLGGAPPGLAGADTPPMLSNSQLSSVTSEKSEVSIVLVDEIEKSKASHLGAKDLLDIFLSVLEGHFTTGKNQTVDLGKTVFIFASNTGTAQIAKRKTSIGFVKDIEEVSVVSEASSIRGDANGSSFLALYKSSVEASFKPEFLNRIDHLVLFPPLTSQELAKIAEITFESSKNNFLDNLPPTIFSVDYEVYEWISEQAIEPEKYNGRAVKRATDVHLISPLRQILLPFAIKNSNRLPIGDNYIEIHVKLSHQRNGIEFFRNVYGPAVHPNRK